MTDVKVTVCTVTYNHERYVAQAVESALAQQADFPYEIVIGDDCSTDGTRQILARFAQDNPDRIRLRLPSRNEGAKANFIATFSECRGTYVVILEGDDYFLDSRKLQRQADALDRRQDWALCFHPARCDYADGLDGPPLLPDGWVAPEATITDLFARNFMATSGVMFRNRLMPELPAWFHESDLGDWPLHILNAAHGNIGFLPEVMSAYRVHGEGLWTRQDVGTRLASIFRMLSAVDHHFSGKYARQIDAYRTAAVQWLLGELESARRALPGGDLAAERERALVELPRVLAENRMLRAEIQSWRRSWAYRIVRETRRPWKLLRALFSHTAPAGSGLRPVREAPAAEAA